MAASVPTPRVPPGPPLRQGLSNLAYYYRFWRDSIGVVGERFDRYGDIYYAPSASGALYVLKHPEHHWEVLVRDGAKYGKTHTAFDALERVLGRGLLTTDGDEWRRQRRMVQPAFGPKRMHEYADAMADETRRTVDRWYKDETRDTSRDMMGLTLRIVSRTLFGHDVRGDTDDVARAMASLQTFIGAVDLLPDWVPLPGRKRAADGIAALDRIIYGIIEDRRRATPRPDLLQMLVDAVDEEGDGGRLADKEIRDQLVTLFLAGHETTSLALGWTFYLLARNPAAESRLHAELDQVLGDRAPAYEDLENLPWTRQVIEEAMRLYPPAYTVARRAEEDAEIGGYPVAKGSEIIHWIWWTHRDPRWFPEPEAFKPERFTPEEEKKRPKLAYLPFGAGARACIGKVFAMVEAQLILATIAQRVRLELVPGQDIRPFPRITLAAKPGIRMIVRRR
jgi:cytochrome P450